MLWGHVTSKHHMHLLLTPIQSVTVVGLVFYLDRLTCPFKTQNNDLQFDFEFSNVVAASSVYNT